MGTAPAEWSACPCEMTQDAEGRVCPNTSIPAEYTPAPSMIPDSAGAGACACLLCGHTIKNCYWLQNDARRWVLRVGSECVTHFAPASGEQLARDSELARAKRAVEMLRALRVRRQDYTVWTYADAILGKGALATDGAVRAWWRYRFPQFAAYAKRLRTNYERWKNNPALLRAAELFEAA